MNSKVILRALAIVLYIILLLSLSDTLSLSFFEVENYNNPVNFLLHYPLHILTDIFGKTDTVLRSFMIFIHLLSIYFFFQISKPYLIKERDRLWNIILFILLPSVLSSAVILHPSGIILLLLLFFVYNFQKWGNNVLWILPAYLFIDFSFSILFFSLILYYSFRKAWLLALLQLMFLVASIIIFGFVSSGQPANYLIQMFGVASLTFSPLLFIYYLYTLYSVGLKGEKDLIWTLSISAFFMMMVLSIRQKIYVEQFAPYLILLLPLMVKEFMHAYRIRIRRLRKSYKILFVIALLFLVINSLSIYFNRYLYLVLDDPKKHFLYTHNIAKELAETLKAEGYKDIKVKDENLKLRLEFYGIFEKKAKYILTKDDCRNVTISYESREVAHFCVTKNNTYREK